MGDYSLVSQTPLSQPILLLITERGRWLWERRAVGTLDVLPRRGASVISTVSLTRKEHQVPVQDQSGDTGDSDDPFNTQAVKS